MSAVTNVRIVESALDPADAIFDFEHPAGTPWMHEVKKGQIFRIVDLEGNQAVDTLFYNAHDTEERYSLSHTMLAQGNIYIGAGTQIMSSENRPMLTVTADTCGRHDTVGGGRARARASRCATRSKRALFTAVVAASCSASWTIPPRSRSAMSSRTSTTS